MLTPLELISKLDGNEISMLPRVPPGAHSDPPAGIAGSRDAGWIGVLFEDGKYKSGSEWTNSGPDGAEADPNRGFTIRV